jgi:cell division protein FtsW
MYLAWGLTSIFAFQGLINTAVVLGAIPAKGLTLPFVSYGGTSLLTSMLCAGVLLNISRRAPVGAPRSAEIRNASCATHRRRKRSDRVRVVVAGAR